jgi:serine protease AprX
LKEDSIIWQGKSVSDTTTLMTSLDLSLPSANKKVKEIKINGQKLKAKKVSLSGTFTVDKKDQITVAAGQNIEIEIEFDKLESFDTSDYIISINNNAQAVASASYGEDRYTKADLITNKNRVTDKAAGKMKFHSKDDSVSWKLASSDDSWVSLTGLHVTYPSAQQSITSVEVDGDEVAFSIDANGQIAFDAPVRGKKHKSVEIEIGFSTLSSVSRIDYSLVAHYSNGVAKDVVVSSQYIEQGEDRDTFFPTLVRANLAHEMGLTGYGVTVAIIDTGIRDLSEIKENTSKDKRPLTIVDVTTGSGDKKKQPNLKHSDENGHGTHLASIITNSSRSYDANGDQTGSYNGIAPDAGLVIVKAFDEQGQASYTDVLKAIDYVIVNKDVLDIKVLNLSFSATPSSYYWNDPLNKALMRAWDAGITVIAAAGNAGPDAMTIGVPGNTPYIITVGAVSDNYTPNNVNDDFVTSFSSAGPTYEGFIKPDLVAPGGHVQGLMYKKTYIRENFSVFADKGKHKDKHDYFELSGSSQSTAVTAGVVALMLQANPNLSPDDIKCRLLVSARPATTPDGKLAVSMFQQGAGLIDAMQAVESTATGCANAGLSIETELAGEDHFIGPARRMENNGDYYIPGVEGSHWSGNYNDTQLWRFNAIDTDSQLWRQKGFDTDSQLWRQKGFDTDSQLWRQKGFDIDSQLWRQKGFDIDAQLWRQKGFDIDSQLWRQKGFDVDSQLWRQKGFDVNSQIFNSNSIKTQWVDHE